MLRMMKVRNVSRARKVRVMRKTRRVRGLAELTVGRFGRWHRPAGESSHPCFLHG